MSGCCRVVSLESALHLGNWGGYLKRLLQRVVTTLVFFFSLVPRDSDGPLAKRGIEL